MRKWFALLSFHSRTIIPAIVALSIYGAFHLVDVDDQLWSIWQRNTVPQQLRQQALWLTDYEVDIDAQPIPGVEKNASGISYNPVNGHFWIVINSPQQLVELDQNLQFIRRIELNNFSDTEAIAYAGEDRYLIADEWDQSLTVATITPHTRMLDKLSLQRITLDTDERGNKGFEGVAVDINEQRIYAVRERDPMRVVSIDGVLTDKRNIHVSVLSALAPEDFFVDDLSGLHFDQRSGHLLLLSDESHILLELSLDGTVVSHLELDSGFHGLQAKVPQPEGVTVDAAANVYVVSEPNLIYRFTPGTD